ncbi:MAG: hypothetical protein HQK95_01925 [Nitrospirae bacterium]|nr:hypothetical protein [Nitrospirota bacterium]
MSVITVPRILREKFGDEVVEALLDVINLNEPSKDLATKADIANLRTELKTDIAKLDGKIDSVKIALDLKIDNLKTALEGKSDSVKTGLEGNIRDLGWKQKLYFLILLFAMLLTNPKAMDLLGKLLGPVK